MPAPRPRATLAALLFTIVACGEPLGVSTPDAEPPVPADLETFDEALASVLRERADLVRRASSSRDAWMALGETYEAHSMHDYALPCYLHASELAPDDPKVWYRLGIAAGNEGDAGLALGSLERTVELAPDYVPARRRLARWYLDLGETAQARAMFEAALALEPDDVASKLGLAQVQLEEDDPQGAIDALRGPEFARGAHAALAHRVRGSAMVRLGLPGALDELQRGQGARPGGTDPWTREVGERKVGESALLLRAGRLVERGQAEAGVQMLEELRERVTDDARVFRRLAKGYATLRRFADAGKALERAIELEPEDADLFVALAAARQQAGDAGGTLEALRGALAVDPAHAPAALQVAGLALQDGRFDEVLDVRDAARAAGLEDATLDVTAGKAELELARAPAARASFARATERDPESADAWAGLALAASRCGDVAATRTARDRARALDPAHPLLAELDAWLAEGGEAGR